MPEAIHEKLKRWDSVIGDPYVEPGAIDLILFLANKLYNDYEPAALQPFLIRLDRWLGNVDNENDQKALLSLLSNLFLAGRSEFESLYRSAMVDLIRWLINETCLDITDADLDSQIGLELAKTWICPITDSLRINSFLKINGLSGHDHRPHWRSLAKFGDKSRIEAYIRHEKIERVVLIEDFVGSGTQIASTVDFAVATFPNIAIAVCPLIICPEGDRVLRAKANAHSNMSYIPTMLLPDEAFLGPKANPGEPSSYPLYRDLLTRLSARFKNDPFGFKSTGAMIVLFSNCPDNTVAAFREESPSWKPLFPRVWRPE